MKSLKNFLSISIIIFSLVCTVTIISFLLRKKVGIDDKGVIDVGSNITQSDPCQISPNISESKPDENRSRTVKKEHLETHANTLPKPDPLLPEPDLLDLFGDSKYPSPDNPLWNGRVDMILSEIYQKYKFSPKPRTLTIKLNESEEVRQLLDPIRENYSGIKNISLNISVKADMDNYSYSCNLKAMTKPKNWMSLDVTTSNGGRMVAASDGNFLMRGEGQANKATGLKITSDTSLPADPMLYEVLNRSYKLIKEKSLSETDPNGMVRLNSKNYTIWFDKKEKLIRRIKTQSENGVIRELIIKEYGTFSDGILYPTSVRSIESLDENRIVCELVYKDIEINNENIDPKEFYKLPDTYFLLK